ncbi:MAG: tRNA (N6-isopentenyl adenosine(37)-C2)-methylthiotransferase MiaB [Patescibacteria group bacterium]|jgi:tRNA-2-methylthio-N6-dimethylallyladenosine synthase
MKNKYFIITIGCQMNKADSERLAAFLESQNWVPGQDFKSVALVVINTCSIRQSAEDRLYGLVNQIKKYNPQVKIVVTGCLSKRPDVMKRLEDRVDLFMPINEIPNIFNLLEKRQIKTKLSLDEVRILQGEKYLSIIPKYQSKFSAYVPIGNGCNNFCSYCVVPYARGREVYRPTTEIIKEIKVLVKAGYKEITLIAQNVNSYHDKLVTFPELLEKIAKISGDFWIRFSSSHPKDVSPELIGIIGAYSKICPHLHLAVQSGDDKILAAMNRKYTVAHFIDLVAKIKKARPGIAVTTDVIVGFPGETRAQFLNTVKLFKKIKFDLVYISRYSPRPGTVSYNLKDSVSAAEKQRREFELEAILKKGVYDNNATYIGREEIVLLEGINKKNKYYGKTGTYKMTLVNPLGKIKKSLVGSFVTVKIESIGKFGLEGTLLK